MNPHYIIDGYNLILNIPRFREALDQNLEFARNVLISLLRGYQSSRNLKITLVFDGDEVGHQVSDFPSTKWLKVIYSRPPEKADPVIKRMIRKAQNKKALIVVTADNDILSCAKQHGAQKMSPNEFYFRATKHPLQDQLDQKYNDKLSQQELDEWLKLFGEDDA